MVNDHDLLEKDIFLSLEPEELRMKNINPLFSVFLASTWTENYINDDELIKLIKKTKNLREKKLMLELFTPSFEECYKFNIICKEAFSLNEVHSIPQISMTELEGYFFSKRNAEDTIDFFYFLVSDNDLTKFIEFFQRTDRLSPTLFPSRMNFSKFPQSLKTLISYTEMYKSQCIKFFRKFMQNKSLCMELIDRLTNEIALGLLIKFPVIYTAGFIFLPTIDSRLKYSLKNRKFNSPDSKSALKIVFNYPVLSLKAAMETFLTEHSMECL